MQKQVLIIDDVHPFLIEELTAHRFIVHHRPNLSKEEFIALLPNYHGLVLRSKFIIDKAIIDGAGSLEFIARAGAGLENIDLLECKKRKIKCINSPEGNCQAVAEHTLGMILCLFNKLHTAHHQIQSGKWDRNANWGESLHDKTIGILGFGNMGKAFYKILKGTDCKVLVYDKYLSNSKKNKVELCSWNAFIEAVDVLSIHIDYRKENQYLIDDAFMNDFKKPIYIVNTSRGSVLKTDDLIENLKSKKVLGACLDVLEYEKTGFEEIEAKNKLKTLFSENVLMSPHVAGWTQRAYFLHSKVIWNKIAKLYPSTAR